MNYRMISKKYIVPLRPDINIRFIMTKIDKSILTFGVTIFLKFILFDILWCIPTTFASLSTVELYNQTDSHVYITYPLCLFPNVENGNFHHAFTRLSVDS